LKKRLSLLIRVLLAAVILGLLFRLVGWNQFLATFSEIRWPWMAAVYLTALISMLVNALLLLFLLRSIGLQVSIGRVILAKSLSTFYALILPGDIFAGVAKWADLSAATGDKARVLSALIFSKIAFAVPPLIIGSMALAASNPFPENDLTFAAISMAVAVITVTVLILHPASGRRIDGYVLAALHLAPDFLRTRGQSLLTAVGDFRGMKASGYLLTLSLASLVTAIGIVGLSLAAKAGGVTVPLSTFFWVSMFLFISRLLPLTVGNLGIREGILVLSFGLYGVEPANAVLVGLLMFSSVFIIAAVGAGYQIAITMGWLNWNISKK
jgi:uncharacterized membrane protein YbhN (UPF0104 family)